MNRERGPSGARPLREAVRVPRRPVATGLAGGLLLALLAVFVADPVVAAASSPTHAQAGPAQPALGDPSGAEAIDSDWPGEPAIGALYAGRRQQALWLDPEGRPTEQARSLLEALHQAALKGLGDEDYASAELAELALGLETRAATAAASRFERGLTSALLRYARHLHQGRVDPRPLGVALDAAPKQLEVAALLTDLSTSADPLARLAEVEPPYRGYRRLQAHLARYLDLASGRDWPALPALPKPVLEPGEVYSGLEALAQRLVLLGDLDAAEAGSEPTQSAPTGSAPTGSEPRYQGAVVTAVQRFQRRHGLLVDGRLGARTLAELNVAPAARARQIELSLERWRWVPIGLRQPPIVVNIPEFQLRAFNADGSLALQMPVVVGAAFQRQTPIFAEQLRTVVFRPYWNVPLSILRRDLLPRQARDPEYFARQGFEIIGGGDRAFTPEVLEDLRRGRLGLRQTPGPANALGRVKFLLPNAHAVYLHDTPATGLFARARRDLSSGCIRVQAPEALAEWVLRQQPDWTPERIRAAMDGTRDDQAVAVIPPIPVLLVYVTAVAPEGGDLLFFDDIYGHDTRLSRALEAARSGP